MEIRRELSPHDPSSPGTALTIGAYDGVHVGHRQVVAEVRRLAEERRLVSAVVTFDRHPATVVRPESAPLLLTDNEQKLEQLATTGVDLTLVVPFDEVRAKEPAEEFVADVLRYEDSYVNESYLDLEVRPWPALSVVQKLRVRFNWQEGGLSYDGQFQRDRRVDFWTWVNRVEYTWQLGRMHITPQYKFMLLRLLEEGVIGRPVAKQLLEEVFATGGDLEALVQELRQEFGVGIVTSLVRDAGS